MPVHRIQGPDGRIHRIEAPDDANPEDVVSFLASQLGAEEKPGSALGVVQSYSNRYSCAS
jgi:hypothetical protein